MKITFIKYQKNLFTYLLLFCTSIVAYPTYFLETFSRYDSAKANFGDTTKYKLVADSFGTCARVSSADSTKGIYITKELNADSLKGYRIILSAWTKATELTRKAAGNNGVKVMIYCQTESGEKKWPQLEFPDTLSSYSWTRSKPLLINIPENAVTISLTFGLELVAGTAWFDSIQVRKASQIAMPPARDSTMPIPSYSSTRLRGAMIGVPPDSAAIANFGSAWNGNLLRWQMNGGTRVTFALQRLDYQTMLDKEIKYLDTYLPICKQHKIKVIIDMHQLSTGQFIDTVAQSLLIKAWKNIATRYKDNDAVWGYDLANEPDESSWSEGALFWNELTDTLARAIREVDPVKPIIIEPPGGNHVNFATLKPVGSNRNWDIPNIVYSFHYYSPSSLTHQGVTGHPGIGAIYPGTIGGTAWDQSYMRQTMTAAIEYQKKYRVPIYVGEFSCIRWAPEHSAYNWLRDAIEIFEEYGWDWSYHAYREYQGWSVEYSDSLQDMRSNLTTDRKELLLSYFSKNKNPYDEVSRLKLLNTNQLSKLQIKIFPDGHLSVYGIPFESEIRLFTIDGKMVHVTRPVLNEWNYTFNNITNRIMILHVRQKNSVSIFKLLCMK